MKILSIGNSFSQDAHAWLHSIAEKNGLEMDTTNAMIGGCSLDRHWANVSEQSANYFLELNGKICPNTITFNEALNMEKWDVITLQQVSGFSGKPETYEPYLSNLVKYVTDAHPQAKLYFHQTWAYEVDATIKPFELYNYDHERMYNEIIETTEAAAKRIGAEIIPVGRMIQKIRRTLPEFDYKNGGMSLCRDGMHLSIDYGRYTAAVTWITTLSGQKITASNLGNMDLGIMEKIVEVVNNEIIK